MGSRLSQFQIPVQVVTQQPVRPEVYVDPLSVGDGRGACGATDRMDLFDLFGRNGAPPKSLARAPVDAERGESFVLAIVFRQENTSTPNDGRRQSRPDGSLPKDILVWAKVNGRFAFAESRGIRSSKLRPPHLAPLLCRASEGEARQNDNCQKSDPR